ncbi:MAG: uracil-DNA glycosylase family protein [Candidatus Nezhaarchaeota archaeon]|nr:uracil-DNA glycosylase family protein [Candidatus Nezhaarchaeota archaeon]
MSSRALALHSLIESCGACSFVDKPMVKYRAYLDWLPEEVRVLAVGESPPPGLKETVFYNTSRFDLFRRCMKLVAGVEEDVALLSLFKSSGVFVTGAVKCRPRSRKDVREMGRSCLPKLRAELKLLSPSRVVAMGRTASSSVSELLSVKPPASLTEVTATKVEGVEVVFTPHPNYVFRFRRGLVPRIREAFFK